MRKEKIGKARLSSVKTNKGIWFGEKNESLNRWAKYFQKVYEVEEETIHLIEEINSLKTENEEPTTWEEIVEIIRFFLFIFFFFCFFIS